MARRVLTVREYAKKWTRERVASGLTIAGDEEVRLRLHALPMIGKLRLDEIRPRHIRDLVKALRAKGALAPRTIRHVYGSLHTMFRDAMVDEVLGSNLCILKRRELPRSIDKDPTWRPGAILSREELARLICDIVVPPDRRVMYALLGVTGVRFGEAAALRWSAYDSTLKPLGRIVVASSWCTRLRHEKPTKTEQPRSVPVHPVLAALLERWKSGGWQQIMGRPALPDDLMVPSRRGVHRSRHHSLGKFQDDLGRLGMRQRRQHDFRRTFISLARADGVRKDVLESITHGQRGNILDLYTEQPWNLLCAEIAKLQLSIPSTTVFAWPEGAPLWASAASRAARRNSPMGESTEPRAQRSSPAATTPQVQAETDAGPERSTHNCASAAGMSLDDLRSVLRRISTISTALIGLLDAMPRASQTSTRALEHTRSLMKMIASEVSLISESSVS